MLGILGGEGKQENKNEVQEMENYGAEAGSAVKLLEELLNLGYRKNASDIHLEPQEDRMVVRMRLDGMLLHVREYDKEMHQPLVTRAKVLSGMDIAKKRVPQDGHFKEMIDGICLDVRTSVVPTIFGEKMVLRLLNMKTEIDHGKTFGMREKNYEKMKRILRSPGGILYLTGPTGCGKTTTLYMILEYLAKQPVNIVTIEDPVERYLPGISQMQVNEQAGITFEAGLRAVLRQDPDIIMVGETRDPDRKDQCPCGDHRSSGALDSAHEKRGGRNHENGRYGCRAVSHGGQFMRHGGTETGEKGMSALCGDGGTYG